LILSLHHDARFLRSSGAVDRAHKAFERVIQFYAVDTAQAPVGAAVYSAANAKGERSPATPL